MLFQGSIGSLVKELQSNLNLLPTRLARLFIDGIFGPLTFGRVKEFQGDNKLVPDGLVGPLTLQAILDAIAKLVNPPVPPVPPPPQPDPAVRVITDQILGTFPATNNLISQIIPPLTVIDESSFRPGDQTNEPQFRVFAPTGGRLAIFAAKKNNVERALILLLPPNGIAGQLLICVTQGFAQANEKGALDLLGWSNPLSPPFIQFVLLKHVINRWGAQTLAGKKNMGFLYIVRAKDAKELGPFTNDGAFVVQCLTEMASLTNGAFSFDKVEGMTFSSGIGEFNVFMASLAGKLNVGAVYNIDPANALAAAIPPGGVRKQFLSGQTGGPRSGFEFMPLKRWKNEPLFPTTKVFSQFEYLHNRVMPLYTLFLGIQTS
jgi:peptidoglycan hydrolase-like protein with peptidoglycan-binding domain